MPRMVFMTNDIERPSGLLAAYEVDVSISASCRGFSSHEAGDRSESWPQQLLAACQVSVDPEQLEWFARASKGEDALSPVISERLAFGCSQMSPRKKPSRHILLPMAGRCRGIHTSERVAGSFNMR